MPNRININCLSFLFALKLLKSLIKEFTLVHKIEPININQKLKAMCNECWGIYPCPICGTDEITEEDYERELDERLNEADDWFQQRLDERLDEDLPFE